LAAVITESKVDLPHWEIYKPTSASTLSPEFSRLLHRLLQAVHVPAGSRRGKAGIAQATTTAFDPYYFLASSRISASFILFLHPAMSQEVHQ